MTKVEQKLDLVVEKIEAINITLARQEENLKEHMRRTEIAELHIDKIQSELAPIKEHVIFVSGLTRLTVGLVGLGASILAILEYFIRKN